MDKVYSKNILLLLYYWICIGIPAYIYTKLYNSTTSSHNIDFIQKTGETILQYMPTLIMTVVSFFIATGITSWHNSTRRRTLKKIIFVNLTILFLFSTYLLIFKTN